MMWLSRNTKLLDSFPLKNGKLKPALCDQVTQCSGSLTISSACAISANDIPSYEAKELWITQDCMLPQHSMSELPCMHLFLPETNCIYILF